jgi:hypothetical protein
MRRLVAAISFAAVAMLTPACTAGDCPDLVTRESATSCAETVVFDGGTYIVVGECVEQPSMGELLGRTTSPSHRRVYTLNDVPPAEAIALVQLEPRCRLTWAYYHEVPRERLREVGPVPGVAWSPDSSRLVTGGSDGTAKVWRIRETGVRELWSLPAQETTGWIGGVAFSPDGTRVMTGDAGPPS